MFDKNILSDSTWRLLFCLYGAPILIIRFLPEHPRHSRVKSEIFLDLFQVCIVVALIYSTFFFPSVGGMLPADALLRNLSISNVQKRALARRGPGAFAFRVCRRHARIIAASRTLPRLSAPL